MKIALLLAVLFCSTSSQVTRTFSVRVKGQFLCHEAPYPKVPIDILHQSSAMKYPDYMARFPNDKGEFDVKAYLETDDYMINPYVVIRHSCWLHKEVPQRCQRKIIWRIPAGKITSAQEPDDKKIFDIGSVDLAFKNPSEVIVKCGL